MLSKISNKLWIAFFVLLLFMAMVQYIRSSEGSTLMASVMGAFPFAEGIMNVIKSAHGYASDIPLVTHTSVLNDIAKLFVSSIIKMGVTSILMNIFCGIPRFEHLSLSERIDRQEQYMHTPSYIVKKVMISFVSSIVVVFAANEILKYIYEILSSGGMNAIKTATYIVVMILALCAYVLVFSHAASIGIGKGVLFALCAKLIPKVLDVFITNSICIWLYAYIYTNGFGSGALFILVCLFIWCVIADILSSCLLAAIRW